MSPRRTSASGRRYHPFMSLSPLTCTAIRSGRRTVNCRVVRSVTFRPPRARSRVSAVSTVKVSARPADRSSGERSRRLVAVWPRAWWAHGSSPRSSPARRRDERHRRQRATEKVIVVLQPRVMRKRMGFRTAKRVTLTHLCRPDPIPGPLDSSTDRARLAAHASPVQPSSTSNCRLQARNFGSAASKI